MGILDMLLKLDARRQGAVLDDQEARLRRQQTEQGVGLAAALRRAGKGPGAPVAQPDGTFKTPVDPEAAAAISLMQNAGSRGLGNQLATNVMDPAWQQQQQNAQDQGYATRQQMDMAASEEARRNQLFPGQLEAQDYAASQDQRDELRTMSYINNLSMDNAAKGHATTLAALQGGLKSEADLRNEYQKAPLLIKGAQAIGSFTMMKRALDENNPMALQSAIVGISQVQEPGLAVRPVDVTAAYQLLDDIPNEVFPGKSRLLAQVAKAENNPKAYQTAMAELRNGIRGLMKEAPGWGDEAVQAMNALGDAGEAAGAASTKVVREQYKNLMTLESIATVRRTGQVPALSAEERIFSRYGPGVARGATDRLEPATAEAIAVTQAASSELARKFRSSGTAERAAQGEVAQDALGLLSGQTNPSAFIRSAGTLFGVGPLAGLASQGKPIPALGRAGAAAAREKE